MSIDRHVINGMVVTAIQYQHGVNLIEFLEEYAMKLNYSLVQEFLDDLVPGMWIVRRGPILIEMQDEHYRAMFYGQTYATQ